MNRFVLIFFTITLFFTQEIIHAQNKYSFKQFFEEGAELYKAPKDWDFKQVGFLTGTAAVTFLTMQFIDETVRDEMLKNREYVKTLPAKIATYYGEPITPMLLGTFFLIHGNSKGNMANKKIGFELIQGASFSILNTGFFKFAFGRARPYTKESSLSFKPFSFQMDEYVSFSSGHTAIAFSMSTVFAENTDNDLLKVIYYIPAFLTGFSRIYLNKHWTSDVVFGALLGYFTTRFFTKQHKQVELIPRPVPIMSFSISL